MPRFKNASVKPVDDGSVLYIVFRSAPFGLIVFRSAPFGKHVGRRKKGEDLFKADRRRTKVRRGRIWAKERQNNRKTKGAEGSRHMKQRFRKCFIVQKRCCYVLYIVFRSAPFGKHVGRRKKGEDLFKADRRRTKVRRGRIWAKERQNNRKTKGAEGSRHMKQRFRKCFIVQKRCCCVLYYCLPVLLSFGNAVVAFYIIVFRSYCLSVTLLLRFILLSFGLIVFRSAPF